MPLTREETASLLEPRLKQLNELHATIQTQFTEAIASEGTPLKALQAIQAELKNQADGIINPVLGAQLADDYDSTTWRGAVELVEALMLRIKTAVTAKAEAARQAAEADAARQAEKHPASAPSPAPIAAPLQGQDTPPTITYSEALTALQGDLDTRPPKKNGTSTTADPIAVRLEEIIKQINALKEKGQVREEELTRWLHMTHQRFNSKISHEDYLKEVDAMQGHPNTTVRWICGLMMGFAALLLCAALVLVAPAASAAALPLAAEAVGTVGLVGGVSGAIGWTFFGGRRTGVSSAALHFENELDAENITLSAV
jgi:hypothetical protein